MGMGRVALLRAERSLLFIVDVQAGLAAAVAAAERRLERLRLLLAAAERLAVPVVVSEHYPAGLGHTDLRLLPLPDGTTVHGKISFSCWREPALKAAIEAAGRPQIVLAGMEAHVCVLQTALDLQAAGFAVHLAADATGSREEADRGLAFERLARRGCEIVSSEMVAFEWLERGDTADFKALIGAIKARDAPRSDAAARPRARLAAVTLVVPGYDEAIAHYTLDLGFRLVEDTPVGSGKRFVRVVPPGGGTALLLARAATPAQTARIGDQAGGRVLLFLDTDDFERDHRRLVTRGLRFEGPPRVEAYGKVAVFTDRYGNRWDLVERAR